MAICDKYVCAKLRIVLDFVCRALVSDCSCTRRSGLRSGDWGTVERWRDALCDGRQFDCRLLLAERRDASEFQYLYCKPKQYIHTSYNNTHLKVSIGFGEKYPNEECPEAVFLMIVQIVMGIAIEGAMVGIVYAKMIRPPRHSSNMKFSRKAVVCQRNSKLCLVFRVCDTRSSHVIGSQIQAYWFEEKL